MSRLISTSAPFQIEVSGEATIVESLPQQILDMPTADKVGNSLLELVKPGQKLVVNFMGVQFASATLIRKLISLYQALQAVGGKLVLCSIRPEIYEVLCICKLNKLFSIHDDRESALRDLNARPEENRE